MRAVEFRSTIDQDTIKVPKQFIRQTGRKVRVILLSDETGDVPEYNREHRSDTNGFGMLAHRANPDLWAEEEYALAKAAVSKHADKGYRGYSFDF